MEYAGFTEQNDGYATTFAFADVCAKPDQKCFDVVPGDIRAGGMCEDSFQSPQMGTFHVLMVPEEGTDKTWVFCDGCFVKPNKTSRGRHEASQARGDTADREHTP